MVAMRMLLCRVDCAWLQCACCCAELAAHEQRMSALTLRGQKCEEQREAALREKESIEPMLLALRREVNTLSSGRFVISCNMNGIITVWCCYFYIFVCYYLLCFFCVFFIKSWYFVSRRIKKKKKNVIILFC